MTSPNYYAIIPASVRYNKNLSASAKLLYGEITALANAKGYCFASNRYFAELYEASLVTVSRLISQLETAGHIKTEIIYDGKQIKERRIYVAESQYLLTKNARPINKNDNTPINKNDNTPINKNVKDNNTSIFNNTSMNNTVNNNNKNTTTIKESTNSINNNPPLSPLVPSGEKQKIELPPKVEEAFSEWLTYKKEKRQGYKPTGERNLRQQVKNKLNTLSEEQVIEAIRLSMAANYQGIIWELVLKQRRTEEEQPIDFAEFARHLEERGE